MFGSGAGVTANSVTESEVMEYCMSEAATGRVYEGKNPNRVVLLGFRTEEFFSACSVFTDALGPCSIERCMDITEVSERDQLVQTIVLQVNFIAFKTDGLIRDIKKRFPKAQLVCYSYSSLGTSLGLRLADAGVSVIFANFRKDCEFKNCVGLLRTKGVYYPADVRYGRENRLPSKLDGFRKLTSREWECLEYSMQGLLVKEIAEKMTVACGTVGTFRRNMRKKLGMDTFMQVLFLAKEYREG